MADFAYSLEATVNGGHALVVQISNGGSVITTGEIDRNFYVPYAATIESVEMVSDDNTSGSIVIDVWKGAYADLPLDNADSITASDPPTISSATKSQDTTLTGWTTSIAKGEWIRLNVDSVTSLKYVTLVLVLTKTT